MTDSTAGTVLLVIHSGSDGGPSDHEIHSRRAMAERLARLKACRFGGDFEAGRQYAGPLYFVPTDTLLAGQACEMGIGNRNDLFGGVVPAPFASTKSITHPLVDARAVAPTGWEPRLPAAIEQAVLSGFSVFDAQAALRAGESLLESGPIRIKRGSGVGGAGQGVFDSLPDLKHFVSEIPGDELRNYGAVIEENLVEVTTYSIGQVDVDDLCISYYGTQHLTRNHDNRQAYGGSTLQVCRGDFSTLLQTIDEPLIQQLLRQTICYDAAASRYLPGFFASRRNYDVALGRDASGKTRAGVLEQSWRIGGATPAEMLALEAFAGDANLHSLEVACYERYDSDAALPPGATVHFRGRDDSGRPLIKYAEIKACK